MSWAKVPLETIYEVSSRNGIYKTKEFHGSGVKIVNMGELFGFEFIGNQEMNRVQMSDVELERDGLVDGDLLFGRRSLVESGAGKCSIVLNPTEPLTFESSIIRVRLDKSKAIPLFYYYWFKSHIGRAGIRAIVSGTNVKGIRGSDLKNVSVVLPPIDCQKRIVEVCKNYDDLIENNRRRIQLLEESARLLYKEWFVHLRFPGHEHVNIVDGVPEGWARKKLKEVAAVNRQSLGSNHKGDIEYIDISCVTKNTINNTTWYDYQNAPGRARRTLKHADILWSCVRPNRRSHAIVWEPHEQLIASTGFAVISAEKVSPFYLYQAITTNDYVGYLTNNAGGAAYPAVTAVVFENSDIIIPAKSVMNNFHDSVVSTYKQINLLQQSNRKLASARDLLLPRLMNGELTL